MMALKALSVIAVLFLLRLFYSSTYNILRNYARLNLAVVSPEIRVKKTGISSVPVDIYSDTELVNAVCSNNQHAIVHLFYKKCLPTFQYHIYKLFPYKEDFRDLVDEFFIYLHEDDWRRLKTFDGTRASLSTWMSVTSFRFFKAYKHSKIDSNGLISISDKWETFVGDWVQSHDAGLILDINDSINSVKNERDREIARLLFIEDKEFQVIADRFELSIDYVYTVKNRLLKQLRSKLNSYL